MDGTADKDNLIIVGDFNGHVGLDRQGKEEIIGAFGFGDINADGERVTDFCRKKTASVNEHLFKP